ncbi:MAG: ribose 5-phosphate isomerase A [archaeon]
MISEEAIEGFVSKYIKDKQVIGIGSGKMGEDFLKKIALKKETDKLEISVVPSSASLALMLSQLHIPLANLNEEELDLAIEFIDLVDYDYNFIKRDSMSFVRDKMISQSAEELIVIAEKKNYVSKLYGILPFEVIPFGWKRSLIQLESLGAAKIRMKSEGNYFKTESGNYVIDVLVDSIPSPEDTEYQSKNIPGVIETGLFIGYADRIILHNDKIEVKSRIGKE